MTSTRSVVSIKQETLDKIQESKVINVSFVKIGTHTGAQTKISFTFYTLQHAYTVEAWANITTRRYHRLAGYDGLMTILKPENYSFTRIDKETGQDTNHSDVAVCKAVFSAVCNELAKRTDKVHTDQYLQYARDLQYRK
jgi:hypothetical protein